MSFGALRRINHRQSRLPLVFCQAYRFKSELPVLRQMTNELKGLLQNPENTYLVGVQHLLPTTVGLFQSLISLGFKPQNMTFTGKPYSTVAGVPQQLRGLGMNIIEGERLSRIGEYSIQTNKKVEALWEQVNKDLENSSRRIERLIILDEGGRVLEQTPPRLPTRLPVIGIEQTRAGMYNRQLHYMPFPVILVAGCAAKREWESDIIAKSVVDILARKLPDDSYNTKQFGVVGVGAVGSAVVEYLIHKGCRVNVYDDNSKAIEDLESKVGDNHKGNIIRFDGVEALVRSSDWTLGCSGKDISAKVALETLSNHRLLVSCSSEDREFKKILDQTLELTGRLVIDPLSDLTFMNENGQGKFTIVSGGFPINFTREASSDPDEIDLTRTLLLAACAQAQLLPYYWRQGINQKVKPQQLKLDPFLQQITVEHCAKEYPNLITQKDLLTCTQNGSLPLYEYLREHSAGEYLETEMFKKRFSKKLQPADSETHQVAYS